MIHTALSSSLGRHNRAVGQRCWGVLAAVVAGVVFVLAGGPVAAASACGGRPACPSGQFCADSGRCVSAVVAVVAGAAHSCALHRDGHVSCWGFADAVKGTTGAISGPIEIAGLDHVVALTAGHHETCALLATRQVRCFGIDDFTLKQEDGTPLSDVRAVALGAGFGCALTGVGTSCWGRNESGQLARPLTTAGSPNAVLSLPGPARLLGAGLAAITVLQAGAGKARVCGWGNNATHLAAPVASAVVAQPFCADRGDVVELSVGAAHGCVRHARGGFSCWGERYYGQLGTGGGQDKADVVAPGRPVMLSAPAMQIATGAGHTCVLMQGGQIQCFGLNSAGQVGAGVDQILKPQVRSGLHGKAIAIGSGSSARHTCAVIADGSVECWGQNDAGQLGDAPKTLEDGRHARTPVRVGF
jgi:alpha-tubulin suppressor-like RCC1 family protein